MSNAAKVGAAYCWQEVADTPDQLKLLPTVVVGIPQSLYSRILSEREQEHATYSDDEFASDGGEYEAEFEDDEAEIESAVEDAPGLVISSRDPSDPSDPDPLAPNFSDSELTCATQSNPSRTEFAERTRLETSEPADDVLDAEDNLKGIPRASSTLESDLFQETYSSPPSQKLTHEQAPSTTDDATNSAQPSRQTGQLNQAETLRSLSTPTVPVVSLVDANLSVPRNLCSTSVPIALSEEISDVHRIDKYRIECRPGSSESPRVRSVPRLPSVEELQTSNEPNTGSNSEEDDSDNEKPESGRTATLASSPLFPRGRSSSFRLKQPVVISPVLRTKSQPFITRLPSVVEVTAEEVAMAESARDEKGLNEDSGSKTSEMPNAIELVGTDEAYAVLTGDKSDKTKSDPGTTNGSGLLNDDHAAEEEDGVDETSSAPLLREQGGIHGADDQVPSSSSAMPESVDGVDDDYEDEYKGQEVSDAFDQKSGSDSHIDEATNEPNKVSTLHSTDEAKNDCEGDSDTYDGDKGFSEELRNEDQSQSCHRTEDLHHEAHMLLQEQRSEETNHGIDSTASDPKESDQREAYKGDEQRALAHTGTPGGIVEAIALLHRENTDEPDFEDHYGGEEFSDIGDVDDGNFAADEEEEFDQYSSDPDENDDRSDGIANSRDTKIESVAVQSGNTAPNIEEPDTLDVLKSTSVSGDIGDANETVASSSSGSSGAEADLASINTCARKPQEDASTTDIDESQAEPANSEFESERVAKTQESVKDSTAPATDQIGESTSNDRHDPQEATPCDATEEEKTHRLKSKSAAKEASAQASQIATPTRPNRPVPPTTTNSNGTRAARPARSVTVPRATSNKAEVSPRQQTMAREQPRELRLKTEKQGSGQPTGSHIAAAQMVAPPRLFQDAHSGANGAQQSKLDEVRENVNAAHRNRATTGLTAKTVAVASASPGEHAGRSPEKVAPRVYIQEYELPPRKAPVFKQKPRKKTQTDECRRKLLPVKSPPNLRIDLPSMDKTKRNWLLLNMFRHGDDVSKYEPFIPKLVTPSSPQSSTGRPARPYSAGLQSYSGSHVDAITAYGGNRSTRNGRRLVTQHDQTLCERERNWASVKPLESAIPTYDSILDKFCTTVTSPVVQRQIYQTRHDDLSPQLAYVLEKRVEKQWKSEASEAFGAASTSYTTNIVPVLATPHAKSPSSATLPSRLT